MTKHVRLGRCEKRIETDTSVTGHEVKSMLGAGQGAEGPGLRNPLLEQYMECMQVRESLQVPDQSPLRGIIREDELRAYLSDVLGVI